MIKVVILLSLVLCLAYSEKWAVLVAGSKTYSNYRHQADVYHAYHSLISKGFDKNYIITFAYDDIANNPSNPFKGKVFNKPSYANQGQDVYEGIVIDYSGMDVTPQNFLACLEGDSTATKGKKVLKTTPNDNVFIFFSDHGSPGLIAFPNKYLYADQMLQTLKKITGSFGKLVFYLETCQSGSMFTKLPTDTKIYGLSAANPTQSSWGTYCSPDDVVQGKHVGSCLGDLFSVNFIEDIDQANIFDQTLAEQFELVKKKTSMSHVMRWGDLSFQSDKVGEFVASSSRRMQSNLRTISPIKRVGHKEVKEYAKMNSRTMRLQSLSAIYARDHSPAIFEQMLQQMASMKQYDLAFNRLSRKLHLEGVYNPDKLNFDCLRQTIDNYEQKCGKFSDYGLQYVKTFAEACQNSTIAKIIKHTEC